MENSWKSIVASYPTQGIEILGTLAIQVLFFWLPSFGYLGLDALFPLYSQQHKLQSASKQPSRGEIWHCFVVVAQNQLLSSCLHLFQIFVLKRGASSYRIEASLPSWPELAREFVLSLLLREALFYYVHRFLHRPSFYVWIHKRHHRFTAPIALAAQYAHPIEHIFANVLPVSLPPQVLGSHIVTFWAFLAYELFNTATVHSGYDFFQNQAKMHDLHHEKFNLNYGSIGLLDWLHGTNTLERRRRE